MKAQPNRNGWMSLGKGWLLTPSPWVPPPLSPGALPRSITSKWPFWRPPERPDTGSTPKPLPPSKTVGGRPTPTAAPPSAGAPTAGSAPAARWTCPAAGSGTRPPAVPSPSRRSSSALGHPVAIARPGAGSLRRRHRAELSARRPRPLPLDRVRFGPGGSGPPCFSMEPGCSWNREKPRHHPFGCEPPRPQR